MKITLTNVQVCLVVLISLSQFLVTCDDDFKSDHVRDSAIDKFLPDPTELGFTTLCYEDIPPLSIDVDGAPAVGPVVYGSADSNDESGHYPLDDEIKKQREEFFKKHKTQGPHQTEKVKNVEKHGIKHELDKEEAVECLKDKVHKRVGKLYDKLNAANDLMNEDFNNINEIDFKKENNIGKQHWNAQQLDNAKENVLKQHWNREILKTRDEKQTYNPFGHDEQPGHKNDEFQDKIHEEIYGDTGVMDKKDLKKEILSGHNNPDHGKMQMNLKQFQNEEKEIRHNVHKVNNLRKQLSNLLDLGKNIPRKDNMKLHEKFMNIELRETTNPYQKDKAVGACKMNKLSNRNEKKLVNIKAKEIKSKRRKRNAPSTKRPRNTKTTEWFMDVDGRFRDIDVVERERNAFDSAEDKKTPPSWIHDDGYRAKTAKKFRPRPPLRYNRVAKEPLDYGSYDKSEYWRYMTQTILECTFPPAFYEIMTMPKLPDTLECKDVCRENFTTSECFRYPDISRLRDTRERKFMKKYYHKEYSDMVDD